MIAIRPHYNYRDFLREELARRSQRNPRYSLRAFARDLSLSASTLSEVLNGHHKLSSRLMKRLTDRLGLSPKQERALQKTKNTKTADIFLEEEAFQLIANWYHFAILELFNTENFEFSASSIAKRLGISEYVVRSALDRLEALKYISKINGKTKLNSPHKHVVTKKPSAAIREFHQQTISKASRSLRPENFDEREFQTLYLAFPKSQIKKAKAMIDGFRQEFSKKFRPKKKKDSVYSLSIQFFELTKGEKI